MALCGFCLFALILVLVFLVLVVSRVVKFRGSWPGLKRQACIWNHVFGALPQLHNASISLFVYCLIKISLDSLDCISLCVIIYLFLFKKSRWCLARGCAVWRLGQLVVVAIKASTAYLDVGFNTTQHLRLSFHLGATLICLSSSRTSELHIPQHELHQSSRDFR